MRPDERRGLEIFRALRDDTRGAQARATCASVDYTCPAVLALIGGLLGHRRRPRARAGWEEPPTLVVAMGGDASSDKNPASSPAMSLVTAEEASLDAAHRTPSATRKQRRSRRMPGWRRIRRRFGRPCAAIRKWPSSTYSPGRLPRAGEAPDAPPCAGQHGAALGDAEGGEARRDSFASGCACRPVRRLRSLERRTGAVRVRMPSKQLKSFTNMQLAQSAPTRGRRARDRERTFPSRPPRQAEAFPRPKATHMLRVGLGMGLMSESSTFNQ